jgi:predicted metal-dependent hydrolase
MPSPTPEALRFLQGYPSDTLERVERLLYSGGVAKWLLGQYPQAHTVRTDKALFAYTQDMKNQAMRGASPVSKVVFDNKLHIVQHALGTHHQVSRVQGSKLKVKREIRVAALFKHTPLAFLRMIVVHELAHLKESAHDRAFYQLCTYMEPAYHQLEFELRVYLCYLEAGGAPLWPGLSAAPEPSAAV